MATILVVDDKELNRSVLNVLLSHQGHRIVEACDGAEALGKAQSEKPELIITDILMPNMDGYEFVRRLRESPGIADAKVIFHSALYREEETRSLAAACGVSTLICKPTEPEEILRIVEGVLNSEPPLRAASPNSDEAAEVVRLLSDKLYQKVEELENLNATLETTVMLRTHELEAANHSLKEQIVSRQKAEEAAAADRDTKLRIKSDFLSHVSHELRSPLTVVHQFVSILLDGLGGSINANQKEYLEIALRNVNQLKGMIDDLLEASRAESCKLTVKRSVVPLEDVLNKTLRSFRAIAGSKHISLQSNIPEHLPPVYADPSRISQVLSNLLDNAVKFSPEKSSITVRAQVLDDDPSFVCVSVADRGCGIDPEESERIFDRLYQVQNSLQASRRGLGLGLFICKDLIALHGGRIWNDTKRRGGSTFSFTVPIFSLGTMIAPIVKKTTATEHSFALITVGLRPLKAWPRAKARAGALPGSGCDRPVHPAGPGRIASAAEPKRSGPILDCSANGSNGRRRNHQTRSRATIGVPGTSASWDFLRGYKCHFGSRRVPWELPAWEESRERCRLPRKNSATRNNRKKGAGSMNKNKILIVEDDQDMVRAMGVRLRAQGYNLAVARDAISAISMARKENPDLIVLDLGLPGGDGFQVMDRLKSLPDLMLVPVIVVSARDPKVNEALALQAGAYAFFQKPYEPGELHIAIQNALFSPSVYKDS